MGLLDRLLPKRGAPTPATAPEAGETHRVLSGHDGHVTAVGFALRGALLLTADAPGNVVSWKAPSFERHFALSHKPPAPAGRAAPCA